MNGYTESLGTHNYILLSQIRDFPNLEGQVRVFRSPRNKGEHLSQQFIVASRNSRHGPRREQRFPVTPLLRVSKLLPSNGRVCRGVY
jgi:hypothetical protein